MGIFRKSLIICFLIFVALIILPSGAQSTTEAEKAMVYKTAQIFLDALIAGDVPMIKTHIAGRLKMQLRTLLNDNKEYSKFLRNEYTNAIYQIDDPIIDGKRAAVNVSIDFPKDKRRFFKIKLEKINKTRWMVTEQTEIFE